MALSSQMQTILFESGRKYSLEPYVGSVEDAEDLRRRFAMTVNMGVLKNGYKLDTELINNLSTYPIAEQKAIFQELSDIVAEHDGINLFKGTQTFYPNFPEEVLDKSEYELCMNALIYYVGENIFGINAHAILEDAGAVEKPKARTELIELTERSPKIISNCKESELHTIMDDRIHGSSLSSRKIPQMLDYKREYPNKFRELISNGRKFSSHEVLTNIALMMYESEDRSDREIFFGRDPFIKDANEVLRLAAVMSNDYINKTNYGKWRNPAPVNDANLSVPVKKMVFHLGTNSKETRERQAFIAKLLDRCPNLYNAIWEKEAIWKKAMPYLGVGPSSHATDRVKRAFDNLHNKHRVNEKGQPIISAGKALEMAKDSLAAQDYEGFADFAIKFPKYFVQNITNILPSCASDEDRLGVCKCISVIKNSVDPIDIMKARNYIQHASEWDHTVYKTHTGKLVEGTISAGLKSLSPELRNKLCEALDNVARESLNSNINLGKVYIDPDLKNNMMPERGERNASGGAVLTRGSKIPSDRSRNLIALGIWWKNPPHMDGCDIDLSATFFDSNFKRMGRIYYVNLRSEYAVHSGDFTDGDALRDGKGVEEILMVDKERARENGVRYAVFYVHGFSVDFNKAENVRCVTMEKEGSFDDHEIIHDLSNDRKQSHPVFCGETIEQSQIDQSIRLNAPASQETPCLFDFERDEYVWLDSTLNIADGIRNVTNSQSLSSGVLEIMRACNNATPSMYQVLSAYAEVNGQIVTDMKEADTLYLSKPVDANELGLKENADIITAYDLDAVGRIGLLQEAVRKDAPVKDNVNDISSEEIRQVEMDIEPDDDFGMVLDQTITNLETAIEQAKNMATMLKDKRSSLEDRQDQNKGEER